MQRILNNPDNIVDEMLEGFLRAHPDLVQKTENPRSIRSVFPIRNRVGVVTGGGSGHKPAFIGYCGKNLCDGIAVGEICSSPTAQQFLDAFLACDAGKGVACLYGNYSGDNMNVKMAVKEAKKKYNLTVKTVVCNDDVASAPFAEREKRRGIAAEVVMYKCGGAMAATGAPLDEVIRVAQKSVDWSRSCGIGLTPCTLPAVGHPNFEIKPGTMEVGVGPHGEPGMRIQPLENAAGMAKIITDVVLEDFENDLPIRKNDEVVILINGMGATPLNELYVLFREVAKLMDEKEIKIYRSYVGNFLTSMDMMGASLTVTKLDDELKKMFDMPCYSMGLKQGEVRIEKESGNEQIIHHATETNDRHTEIHKKEVDEEKLPEGEYFRNSAGKSILMRMVKAVQNNKDFLGEVDGLIGDGDHGMNMNKGFTIFEERFGKDEFSFADGLEELSEILMKEIGGSMGPIYGTILGDMAETINESGKNIVTLDAFTQYLQAGLKGLQGIVDAKPGDKTLVDTLAPAVDSLVKDAERGTTFSEALEHMSEAALEGRNSTKELVAKFGRASRLGERSRGVLDAGACSCYIILSAMADGIKELL